jgi:glycosyltransferase involved in cell wall biosynthesis
MRVAIVAEHASAKFGGEAFLPLHYFRVLRARGVEAWLVVHARTRNELEALFPADRDRMRFVEDTALHRFFFWVGQKLPRRVGEVTVGIASQLYTQLKQREIVRQLVAEEQIDVIHQPIPVSPKSPSCLYGFGVPVIIGPMNGGMDFPPGIARRQSPLVDAFVGAGRWLSELIHFVLPGKRLASLLLVANERTAQALPKSACRNVKEVVENGVDLSMWPRPERRRQQSPIRFLFSGRLVDWKAVDALLDAFAPVAREFEAVLEILGDGPMRPALERQASELGLGDAVIFRGWMSQSECAQRMREADVFVLPSLLECGGAVVLEAMSAGLPVVATKWGGPVDYVSPQTGILVDPASADAHVRGMTEAMLRLGRDPEVRLAMGAAGHERVRRLFDWERKVDAMLEIYRSVLPAGAAVPALRS